MRDIESNFRIYLRSGSIRKSQASAIVIHRSTKKKNIAVNIAVFLTVSLVIKKCGVQGKSQNGLPSQWPWKQIGYTGSPHPPDGDD